jgi:hypothetical protein
LPFPAWVEVMAEVILSFVPVFDPVTVTLNVHALFALTEPPLKVSRPPPVMSRVPLQWLKLPSTAVTPEGRVSVKPMPVNVVDGLGLEITNWRIDVSPVRMEVGEKDLSNSGGEMTIRVSVA